MVRAFHIYSGVKQGGVIGPLLFTWYHDHLHISLLCQIIPYIPSFIYFSMSFQIHDGPNETSPAFPEQPRYVGGSWSRPVIAATSRFVFLKFTPGPTHGRTYVGFKASYWTVQREFTSIFS